MTLYKITWANADVYVVAKNLSQAIKLWRRRMEKAGWTMASGEEPDRIEIFSTDVAMP